MHRFLNGRKIVLVGPEKVAIEASWVAEDARVAQFEIDFGYIAKRKAEYPPTEEQLDHIFHNGIASWAAMITVIKDKYPKPGE